jgi:thiamine-monophosphate kinase
VGEGEILARSGATAMIDVSDGLALDLSRICEAGEVGARVQLGEVPVSPLLGELASQVEVDPLDLALHGGEDYELIATIPATAAAGAAAKVVDRFGTPVTDIGEITESGLVAVAADGSESPLEPRGWDHFA